MALPPTRPLLPDGFAFNGGGDLRDFQRRMVRWLQFTYANDVAYYPQQHVLIPHSILPSDPAAWEYSIFVPEPLTQARRVEFRVFVTLHDSGTTGSIVITPTSGGGAVQSVPVTYASLGSSLSGWVSFSYPCTAPTVLTLSRSSATPTYFVPSAVSAWWEPMAGVRSDITVPTSDPGWIDPAWFVQDRPDATYVLRWLLQRANLWTGNRTRQIANFGGEYTRIYGADRPFSESPYGALFGTSPTTIVVYRTKVLSSGLACTRKFRARVAADDQANLSRTVTFDLYVNGSLAGTQAISSTNGPVFSDFSVDTSVSFGAAAELEIEVRATASRANSGQYLRADIGDIEITEEDYSAALPGGVPADFPSLSTAVLDSSRPIILADLDASSARGGRRALVEAMAWLYDNGKRILQAANPFQDLATPVAFYPNSGDQYLAAPRFKASAGTSGASNYVRLFLYAGARRPGATGAKDLPYPLLTERAGLQANIDVWDVDDDGTDSLPYTTLKWYEIGSPDLSSITPGTQYAGHDLGTDPSSFAVNGTAVSGWYGGALGGLAIEERRIAVP